MADRSDKRGIGGLILNAPTIYPFVSGDVRCSVTTYKNNGTLAVELHAPLDLPEFPPGMDPYQKWFATVTLNLSGSAELPPDIQFVDERDCPGIARWLTEHDIAHPVGIIEYFENWPFEAFRFNLSKKEYDLVYRMRQEVLARESRKQPTIKR